MYDIKIEMDSTVEAVRQLERRTSQSSMRLFLRRAAQPYLANRINNRFASEGDGATGKWQELTETTQRIRALRGFPAAHPINRRTGAMQQFLTHSFDVASQGLGNARLNIPGAGASREMRDKIRIAQQGGVSRKTGGAIGPSRPAPARPVLAFDNADPIILRDALLEWIKSPGASL